jgi:hypothetical protein
MLKITARLEGAAIKYFIILAITLPAIVISTECQTEKVCLIKMHNF